MSFVVRRDRSEVSSSDALVTFHAVSPVDSGVGLVDAPSLWAVGASSADDALATVCPGYDTITQSDCVATWSPLEGDSGSVDRGDSPRLFASQ